MDFRLDVAGVERGEGFDCWLKKNGVRKKGRKNVAEREKNEKN